MVVFILAALVLSALSVPTAGGVVFGGYAICGDHGCPNILVRSDLPPSLDRDPYSPGYLGWVFEGNNPHPPARNRGFQSFDQFGEQQKRPVEMPVSSFRAKDPRGLDDLRGLEFPVLQCESLHYLQDNFATCMPCFDHFMCFLDVLERNDRRNMWLELPILYHFCCFR